MTLALRHVTLIVAASPHDTETRHAMAASTLAKASPIPVPTA